MPEPFLGEIRIMSFVFPPKSWALCNGQFLPINQNQALFSLLGTAYGGNGQTTFALPDLRARAPYHVGSGAFNGQSGGEAAHTLTLSEMPAHVHQVRASSTSGSVVAPATPGGQANSWAVCTQNPYIADLSGGAGAMDPGCTSNTGGSQAHPNWQPFLVLSFCIALQGIFPSQN
jgi:microcystin-dependent protein